LLCLLLGIVTACNKNKDIMITENTNNAALALATNETAIIKTALGEMTVEFWPDVAPNTVENFKKLSLSGFYDGTAFHRIIKGFMIQGGDPLTKNPQMEDLWGSGNPGYKIKAEFNNRPHIRGVISMAREGGNPDSAGCQFFICLDTARNLDSQYTAFGHVVKGYDVLDKLGDTPVTDNGQGEKSRPITRTVIESIRIVPATAVR
jgi:peptidyl-prolyl cis-trans isomerase B (cyclophilin B)